MRPDRLALAVIAFAALLFAPAVGIGLFADDYWWVLGLGGGPGAGPFDMDFATARPFWEARGVGFWWASDSFRWALWRPLAVTLFDATWQVFGASPRWQLVNLAGYLLLLAAAWPIHRRLLGGRLAVVAFFVFATQFSHMQTVWFNANAHTWLAAIPGLVGLGAWMRWREGGARTSLGLALAGLAAGLAASETALGVLPFVCAYECVFRPPRAGVAIAGALALGAAYVALHAGLGYGARDGGLYLDPRADPLAYAAGLLARTPVLLSGALGVLPADLWVVAPPARPALVIGGLGGAALLTALLATTWRALPDGECAAVRFGVIGAALGLPVFAGAPPGGRLLLWATLGTAIPVAVALAAARRARVSATAGWRLRALFTAPVALAVTLAPLAIPVQLRGIAGMAESLRHAALAAPIDADKRVVVVAMPDALTATYLLPARLVLAGGAVPAGWTTLSAAAADHLVARPRPDTLELTVLGGRMWDQPFEQLFLPPAAAAAPAAGPWRRGPVTAAVLESDATGPVRVRFTFDPPPDAHGWQLLAWQDGALRPFALPDVGRAVTLRASASPFAPRPGAR